MDFWFFRSKLSFKVFFNLKLNLKLKFILNHNLSFGLCFLISGQAFGLGLGDYLSQVQSRHRGLRAFTVSKEISEEKRVAGDLSLVPVFQLKAQSFRDEKAPSLNGTTTAMSTVYSLGFNQKFSTGTSLGLAAQVGSFENQNISPAFASAFGRYVAGSLNFSVSQSLWKDAFGQATQLRRNRESLVSQVEKFTAEFQIRKLLVEAERAYWDLIYSQEELELRRANLNRAQKIESWVARRHSDGIADQADLLNAKALLASRRLQLLNSEDDFKGSQQKVKDMLELPAADNVPQLEGSLRKARAAEFYIGAVNGLADGPADGRGDGPGGRDGGLRGPNVTGTILSLEALFKKSEAQIKDVVSAEVSEGLKSDLVLSASYASNPYKVDGTIDESVSNLFVFSKPTSSISLSWVYLFDGEIKSAQLSQARKEALSSTLSSDRAALEGASQWKEYLRRHSELSQKIQAAEEISHLQRDRAKAEQDKFSKGRSITQAVITAEQDAAEAEAAVNKLKAEQRKLETQGRLFVSIEGSRI